MNSLTKLFPHLKLSRDSLSKYFPSNNSTNFIKSNKISSISQNKITTDYPPRQNSTKLSSGFFKITLRRSPIGLPSKRRLVVKALGLRRLQQTVYHSQTPYIAGMILKVKEILQVRNVKRIPAPEERKKRAENGYVIIKKHNPNL
ncbi:16507_t:CDS:1 [Funneliformis geosporum]|uniref:Large ribosomal subunit protein uL30m n=1 Tax=Funneliformis geosporum TaxID=1117311 RepID=A0A9W4SNP1_9GLOM|nr:16507_t:CDS:1 [Funneliformis geosporum]CAI2174907.1 2074_t:CDS:1 [Funneliformis geosporum]